MIPFRDDVPTDRVPVVTLALIAATVVVLLLTGVGLLHLIAIALFLWLFGATVEDATGRLRFLALSATGALVAGAAQLAVDPPETVPLAGASGAVAATMGAYLRLYPWARIMSLVLMVLFFTIVAVPAVVLMALWAGVHVALAATGAADVALAGQLAGFAFGALVAGVLATRVKAPEAILERSRAATP